MLLRAVEAHNKKVEDAEIVCTDHRPRAKSSPSQPNAYPRGERGRDAPGGTPRRSRNQGDGQRIQELNDALKQHAGEL